eukprot:557655-Rhodomonas_salina.1
MEGAACGPARGDQVVHCLGDRALLLGRGHAAPHQDAALEAQPHPRPDPQAACNAPPARPSRPPELSCRHARDWARDLCARAQEWPHNWKDFIPQIVESGKTNETLCGNNMQILRLLSEEVFEFSLKQLTSKKIETLKESLTQEFQLIYQFCEFVMQVRCARESERASEAEREREREREITCV